MGLTEMEIQGKQDNGRILQEIQEEEKKEENAEIIEKEPREIRIQETKIKEINRKINETNKRK